MQRMKIVVLLAVVGGIMGCQVAGGMTKAERDFFAFGGLAEL